MLNKRLLKIVEYSQKNPTSFAKDLNSTTVENFRKLLKNDDAKPGVDIITEILQVYSDISPDWLLFERGEMLRTANISKPETENRTRDSVTLCPECAIMQKVIDAQQDTISTQKKLISALEICCEHLEKKTKQVKNSA